MIAHSELADRDWYTLESLTIDNTVGGVALSASKYAVVNRPNAALAFLSLETAQIRFTLDGTAPTTTVGHILDSGQNLTLRSSNEIARFRAIRTGASSGVITVSYAR